MLGVLVVVLVVGEPFLLLVVLAVLLLLVVVLLLLRLGLLLDRGAQDEPVEEEGLDGGQHLDGERDYAKPT